MVEQASAVPRRGPEHFRGVGDHGGVGNLGILRKGPCGNVWERCGNVWNELSDPTWWNRLLRYPNVALKPFVGSETMVRLSIMLDNLRAMCFNLFEMFGTFGNVWNELSVWLKNKTRVDSSIDRRQRLFNNVKWKY